MLAGIKTRNRDRPCPVDQPGVRDHGQVWRPLRRGTAASAKQRRGEQDRDRPRQSSAQAHLDHSIFSSRQLDVKTVFRPSLRPKIDR
jgi:hypothetical protein